MKRIGSTTHLQVRLLTEQAVYNGTPMITIQVEAYPLESLAKATQFLVEALCEVIIECVRALLN